MTSWPPASTRHTSILVTGFGAFPGAPSNPTERIVKSLQQRHGKRLQLAGIELATYVLPVVYNQIEARIRALLSEVQPDIIVHLGLAGRRKTISVETRAINRMNIIHPDASGKLAGRLHIETGGACVRRARWPAAQIATAIKNIGFPARISIDAGDYLCNQALYVSLGLHKGLCGFIHVPPLRKNAEPGRTKATLGKLENAVVTALGVVAVAHRRRATSRPNVPGVG